MATLRCNVNPALRFRSCLQQSNYIAVSKLGERDFTPATRSGKAGSSREGLPGMAIRAEPERRSWVERRGRRLAPFRVVTKQLLKYALARRCFVGYNLDSQLRPVF